MSRTKATNNSKRTANAPAPSGAEPHDRRSWFDARPVAPVVLVTAFITFYHRLLFGINHLWEDYLEQAYPNLRYALHCVSNGWFPLWTPYVFAGMPFHSDPQTTLFYPPYWLVLGAARLIGNADLALTWFILLHVLVLGFGACLLGRDMGLRKLPALLTGIVFMFSGFVTLHVMHTFVYVAAWFPFAFRSLRRAVNDGSVRDLGIGALLLGMSTLGGYPQYSLHIITFMLAWTLTMAVAGAGRSPRLGIVRLAAYSLMVTLALGIAAVQYLPAFEHMAASVREKMTLEQSCEGSLRFGHLITMFVPKFFGSVAGDTREMIPYWGAPGKTYLYWETVLFVGLTPLLLMPFGLLRFRTRREVRFLSIAAGVLLILALGCGTPLYPLVFKLIPGFGSFRIPGRFSFLMSLCIALLGGYGLDELLRGGGRTRARAIAFRVSLGMTAVIWLFGLLLFAGVLWSGAEAMDYPGVRENAHKAAGTAILVSGLVIAGISCLLWSRLSTFAASSLVVLVFIELFAFGHRFACGTTDPRMYYESVDLSALHQRLAEKRFRIQSRLYEGPGKGEMLLPRNLGNVRTIPLVEGYNQLQLSRFSACLFRVDPEVGRQLLNVRFIKAPGQNVLRTLETPPRFYLANSYTVCPTIDSAVAAVNSPTFVPGRDVVLEKALSTVTPGGGREAAGRVTVVKETPNRIELSVHSDEPALLCMSEIYYSAWRATVNGNPTEILPANVAFRALELPAGRHEVVVEYASRSLHWGMTVSALAALCALLVLLGPRMAGERGRKPWLGLVHRPNNDREPAESDS